MKTLKWLMVGAASLALMACGGGGGSSGTPVFGSGSGTGTSGGSNGSGSGGGTVTTASYLLTMQVERAGTPTTQITSTETVQSIATVTTADGTPVEGVVVSFAESGPGLLTFAPAAATALTGADGKASIDIKAADLTKTGATTVGVSGAVGSTALTPASQSIQINAGALTPGVPAVPGAINFIGSSPSGTAIVIKGAGGNGRSESAILTFRIVDASNAPINDAQVDFSINTNNGGATLSQASAVSNSDGSVSASVSSGALPASIVVTATAHTASSVTSQSDTLLVSNSVPTSGAFEINAAKYNLDGRRTGDSTTITASVADANGNPVPDGVAVSMQTDAGVVGSSTQGGCVTANGTCTVTFKVQAPRGDGIATVLATVRVGSSTTLADAIQINMAGATGTSYVAVNSDTDLTVPTKLTLNSCKQSFELALSDGNGRSTAAGTTIGSSFASTGVTISMKSGTPVLDQLGGTFTPTLFGFEIDLTSTSLVPRCNAASSAPADSPAFLRLSFTTPNGVVFSQRIGLAYPQ